MPMLIPNDYSERVYAGVLGKLIGVYLGRPIEGWQYRDIVKTFGQINYYVHEQRNHDLVVTDDDISGTFTFLRALEDHPEAGANLSAEQVGKSWLNYIIENKTILWWGGMGLSTEHTAFLRLLSGVPAPRSGSTALNGRIVAEQIGAQIFIDGWGMVAPGQPDLAARLAKAAASVSHDGEAVFAAQVIAAAEAQAFVEPDMGKLLDVGTSFIPKNSLVYRMIGELREMRAKTDDWQRAMTDLVEQRYGYDKYVGNCHVIPNHALVILALLWGDDDFQKSLMIANTLGWDTDCNSGNVGCLMGIKNGLSGIDAGPDLRGPVADRMYLPTADAGACITDAARTSLMVENFGRRLAGQPARTPKDGARFHFTLPGSVQGFVSDEASPDSKGAARVSNTDGRLTVAYTGLATGRVARVTTRTFIDPKHVKGGSGYGLVATPTLYPSQTVTATVAADAANVAPVTVRLLIRRFDGKDQLIGVAGPGAELRPGQQQDLRWTVPATGGQPIAEVGFEVVGTAGAGGRVYVDRVHWRGTPPSVTLDRPAEGGSAWSKAWADGTSGSSSWSSEFTFRVTQNRGRGLFIHGTRDWADYTVSTWVTPILATACGLAARVQGMRRYYAVLLATDPAGRRVVRLVKVRDTQTVLAEQPFEWSLDNQKYELSLQVIGTALRATVVGGPTLTAHDAAQPLPVGGIGLVIEEGRMHSGPVQVTA